MRDRTFVGDTGRKIAGTEVISTLWDTALENSSANRENMRKTTLAEIERSIESNARRSEILEGFHALATT